MADQNIFKFPVFIIKKVTPLLWKNDRVFAYKITATTKKGGNFQIYENEGINLTSYLNKEVECLLEITRGEFIYNEEEKLSANIIALQYQWLRRGYEFFPELVKLKRYIFQAEDPNEDVLRTQFEASSTKIIHEWGLNGLGISIYQSKPVLNSSIGFFLINEYQFEEEIDDLELNEKVHIRIDEFYLRGIRPLDEQSLLKWKQAKEQEKNSPPPPEPHSPNPK